MLNKGIRGSLQNNAFCIPSMTPAMIPVSKWARNFLTCHPGFDLEMVGLPGAVRQGVSSPALCVPAWPPPWALCFLGKKGGLTVKQWNIGELLPASASVLNPLFQQHPNTKTFASLLYKMWAYFKLYFLFYKFLSKSSSSLFHIFQHFRQVRYYPKRYTMNTWEHYRQS